MPAAAALRFPQALGMAAGWPTAIEACNSTAYSPTHAACRAAAGHRVRCEARESRVSLE